jgi:uncharacterized protein (TIGR02246 family)
MTRHRLVLALGAAAAVAVAAGWSHTPPPAAAQPPKPAAPADPALKALTDAFRAAFEAGDAKAVAALWTENAEMIEADGNVVRGRGAIEAAYAELFKDRPKLTVSVERSAARPLGPTAVVAEGVMTITAPDGGDPDVTNYSALAVREGDGWKLASVRSTLPDPHAGSLDQLDWLAGEWTAKGEAGVLTITYAWDENKAFLTGKYAITKDGKVVASGTQILGRNPDAGARAWTFDGSGTTSEGVWVRDGKRWVCETTGLAADGTEVAAVNVLVPLGPDAFTWQTTDRTADGEPQPALPPVKVTRVKK